MGLGRIAKKSEGPTRWCSEDAAKSGELFGSFVGLQQLVSSHGSAWQERVSQSRLQQPLLFRFVLAIIVDLLEVMQIVFEYCSRS